MLYNHVVRGFTQTTWVFVLVSRHLALFVDDDDDDDELMLNVLRCHLTY